MRSPAGNKAQNAADDLGSKAKSAGKDIKGDAEKAADKAGSKAESAKVCAGSALAVFLHCAVVRIDSASETDISLLNLTSCICVQDDIKRNL